MVKTIKEHSDVCIFKKCELEKEKETVASYYIDLRQI